MICPRRPYAPPGTPRRRCTLDTGHDGPCVPAAANRSAGRPAKPDVRRILVRAWMPPASHGELVRLANGSTMPAISAFLALHFAPPATRKKKKTNT